MLGIMENKTEATTSGQPPENPGLKSPLGPTKVKSSTIDMFFKSPPKQSPKPTNILGYFKPVSDPIISTPSLNSKVSKPDTDANKLEKNANEGINGEKTKKNQTKKRKDSTTASGDALVNGKRKETTIKTEGKSKSKGGQKADKTKAPSSKETKKEIKKDADNTEQHGALEKTSKVAGKTKSKGGEKVGKKKAPPANKKPKDSKKKAKNAVSNEQNNALENGNNSLDDVNKASKMSSSNLNHQVSEKVEEKADISPKESSKTASSIVSYQDFLGVGDKREDEVEGKDDVDANDADTSMVISYEDFLSQSSNDEEEEEPANNKRVKNDNENNHLSEDLVDVDMEDVMKDQSVVAMETDETSDDDIFGDGDVATNVTQPTNAVNNAHNDVIKNDKHDTCVINKTSGIKSSQVRQEKLDMSQTDMLKLEKKGMTQVQQEKNEMTRVQKEKKEMTRVQQEKKGMTQVQQEKITEEDDDDLCIPKRKEVHVTAEIHTPPVVTPATSPLASPGSSPVTSKLKSNVVVDVADLNLGICVEETDVNNRPVMSSGFSTSGSLKSKSTDCSIKPVSTKVYSIFQKKTATKELSQSQESEEKCKEVSKDSTKAKDAKLKKSSRKSVEELVKSTKANSKNDVKDVKKNDIEQDESESKKTKLSLKKGGKSKAKTVSNSDLAKPNKDQEGIDKSTDQKDNIKGKKRKLSLNKNKQNSTGKSTYDRPRRLSGIKASKGILEQLQVEAEGSETVTSQEDIAPPKKKTLKELFPSATDTGTSDQGDDKVKGQVRSVATPGKARKKLTKQRAVISGDDSDGDDKEELSSPKTNKKLVKRRSKPLVLASDDEADDNLKTPNKRKKVNQKQSRPVVDTTPDGKVTRKSSRLRKVDAPADIYDEKTKDLTSPKISNKRSSKRKSQPLDDLASDDGSGNETTIVKSPKASKEKGSKRKSQIPADMTPGEQPKKKTRPRKVEGKGTKKKGPVKTSSPKVLKTKSAIKKEKAKQLLKKAKATKTSPSKLKRSLNKTIEILDNSTEDKKVKTKPMKSLKDVLGKKVDAKPTKSTDIKKNATKGEKKKSIPKQGAEKDVGDQKKQDEVVKSQKQVGTVTMLQKKKINLGEPKKVPANLCPLFTKEGQLAASKRQTAMLEAQSQSSQDAFITLSDDDSCDTRLSQGGDLCAGPLSFSGLISGARQKDQEKKDLPFPAFPSVSHVFQKDEAETQFWDLPKVNLPLRAADISFQGVSDLKRGMVTLCRDDDSVEETQLQDFEGHPEFSQETLKILIEDICKNNTKVPVRKLFKRYQAKSKGEPLPPNKADKGIDKSDKKFTQLKSEQKAGKRKSEAILDNDEEGNSRRKRSRQDAGDMEVGSRRSRRNTKMKEEEHGAELRRSKRKGKEEVKGQEKSEFNSAIPEKDEATIKAEKLASMLWTEKYQPTCTVEVIGNTSNVKKLSNWLDEWRKRFLKEKKKMKKMKGRFVSLQRNTQDRIDSDDDFDMSDSSDSDSDYSDEEDLLCNTMLISGPSGCGKTAAINACAQEHGFKIFEVNASSKRIGRQILSELGEATQSHHLVTKPGLPSGINSFFKPGPKMSPGKSPSKSPRKKVAKQDKKPPIPRAFANFFKKASAEDKKKDSPKSAKKTKTTKPKDKLKTPTVTLTTKKTDKPVEKTVPSTSIIVFEEIDVVFEEDKGFLAAIASFMETTKRPIILTTSDPEFAANFEGVYESLVFKRPSKALLSTHLQLTALAENVFTSSQDMKLVAEYLGCDIRKSITALQYWISTGAKRTCALENDSNIVCKNTKKGKRKLAMKPKQNPTDNVEKMNLEDKIDLLGEFYETKDDRSAELESRFHEMMNGEAVRHDCCLEAIMGIHNGTGIAEQMTRILQSTKCELGQKSTVSATYQHTTHSEITYNNFYHLLHKSIDEETNTSQNPKLGKKLVTNTAKYLDNLSIIDAIFPTMHDGIPSIGCYGNQRCWQAEMKASMLDLPGDDEEDQFNGGQLGNMIRSEIQSLVEILSFNSCSDKYHRLLTESAKTGNQESEKECCKTRNQEATDEDKQETSEACVNILPDAKNTESFKLCPPETTCPDVYSVVFQRLPNHMYCSHESVAVDYLPTVRQICRSERWRQEAALKRRFLHYLDYNGIGLKSTDYLKLASALDVHPQRPPPEDSFLSVI